MTDHMDNWTPKPGELVLVIATGNWELWRDTTSDRLSAPVVGKHGLCKPLLPAVTTPDEAWEALRDMPGCAGEPDALYIRMEASSFCVYDSHRYGLTCRTFVDQSIEDDYAARGRDYQKEGAIREWLKQVQG